MDMITEYHADGDYEIISIGSVGSDFFKARGMNVAFELRGLADQPSFEQVRQIISQSVDMFVNEIFDELYVCYNHHVNSLTSQVRVQQMLPISDLVADEAAEEGVTGFELE
ncbi:F0F1 ATP synthase subunit gamma, partial [Staphylococcus pseudintermedius]|nr:F0F1 ATP synthase subunit gamma [Staphylococcus pseudintermedius]